LKGIEVKTGLRRSIAYLQSKKVRVPTVIGILRPVVLIPSMIISGLPADQLETIIVHELAHIRRHDFLVNIMQSIMEALFFYHPVVWIISENIRQDREKCCDDFTVRVCGQISLYARALACLSELQIKAAIPSVAITGNKKNIVHRVERLINNKKMKTNMTERLMAGLVLVTSVLVITLSTGATFKPSGFTQVESQIILPFIDKKAAVPVTDTEPVAETAAVAEPAAVSETATVSGPVAVSEPAAVSPDTPPAAPSAAAKISLPTPVLPPAPVSPPTILSPPTPVSLPTPVAAPTPVAVPTIISLPVPAVPADTSHRHHRDKMDIKDNIVTREFHNRDGEDHEMKFVIKQGKVKELYVDGQRIPDNEFPKYQKEIDITLDDLQDMQHDLKYVREEFEHLDFDEIRKEIEIEMQHFKEHEIKDLQKEMQKLQEEQFKNQLDEKALQAEIEQAMADMERGLAEAKKGMAMMEKEDMQKIMDEAFRSVQDIDYDEIQKEIEEAMKEIEEIDFAEIEREMQTAMQNMEQEKLNLDKEKKNLDEMIEELEKLELENK
jgi:hypothetical protein